MTSLGEEICCLAGNIQKMQFQSGPPPVSSPPPVSPPPAAMPLPPSAPFPHLSKPDKFSGDSGDCQAFLVQCGLHFELQAAAYPTEQSKVAFIISHLSGRAEAWATAEWSRHSPICDSLKLFSGTFTKIFQHTTPGREAARAISSLRQGERRVADYAIEFRTLAADSGWNDAALLDSFLFGLSDPLKDQLAPLDLPEDLDSVIALAIKIDKRLLEREREKRRPRGAVTPPSHKRSSPPSWRFSGQSPSSPSPSPPVVVEEPMQLGRTRLSPEERQRRLREGRCIYCAQLGHLIATCPVKDRAHQ